MDLAAIRTLIQAAGYGRDSDSIAAEDAAVDAVLLEIAGERPFSQLNTKATGTLTIGSEFVPVINDLIVPREVRLSRGTTSTSPHYTPLTRLQGTTARNWLYQDQGTDLPDQWGWVDRRIIVYPRPDFAYNYEVDYVKTPDPTTFDDDAEPPWFENRFHPMVAWGAIRWLATRQRDQTTYALAKGEYEQALAKFSRADEGNTAQDVVEPWAGWSVLDGDTRL